MSRIPTGAAVRNMTTGKLGRTIQNPGGNIRGHVWVQWDGERDRQTVSLHNIALVADTYDTARVWEATKAAPELAP